MFLKVLEGDNGITELLRDYKGCNVISLYFEEKAGPLLSVDVDGNILHNDDNVPQLEYIPQVEADSIDETGASWEFVGEVEDMSGGVNMGEGEEDDGHGIEEEDVGEAVSNDGNEGMNANESEGVAGIEEVDVGEAVGIDGNEGVNANESEGVAGIEEVDVDVGEAVGIDGNEGVSDNESEGVVGTEEVEVGEGEGGESESNSDTSSASECPSWMLEDLEGPWDDDIFSNRPENYTRTMLKTLRSFIKEKRKKKHEDKQNQRGETSGMGAEQWFSDCEEEELRSVRGSDDEGERCPEWNDRMDMGEVDLAVGMKFETKKNCRYVIRDWAIKSIKGRHTCAHRIVNRQANSKYIGKRIEPFLRDNPTESLQSLKTKSEESCRLKPIIGLDGCFLKGLYKGQLLAAIGRDPNENIYPIAFAFVEVEKFDSWLWFLRLLLRDIGSQEERGWAFISDRQKGLIDAVAELALGQNIDSV
ncbi:UNVERIFIED_CONTAM: hypothetical protein Slati_3400200 [Sesamum latifolium]|uniref:MULE transposase domain-containing protein n=1 Tax=Sesamum latifolium TaxID=2727402 RepID=A0AAW2UGI9_9LAMI